MRGFPKTIGSRQDLENLLANPELAGQARAKLQELEIASTVWVKIKELGKVEMGSMNQTQTVLLEKAEDGQEKRYQMELHLDPGSCFCRLGLAALVPATEPQPAEKQVDPKLVAEGVKDA